MEKRRLTYAKKKWAERKNDLGAYGEKLDKTLKTYEGDVRDWMTYLLATLPYADLCDYPIEAYEEGVRHALMVRETIPWCKALPEDIFTDYVFYPRINTEDYEEARPLFYGELMPRLKELVENDNIEQAVLETNYWCQEHVTYQMADDRTKSAVTSYRSGAGRCGEESTFSVTAMRAVGIPARQVYAPWWSHCDDNHAWVEIYIRGKWHFTGACEPGPRYDTGWFTNASSRAMIVHTRTFTGAATQEDLKTLYKKNAGRFYVEDGVTYEIITDHYANVVPVTVKVLGEDGQPAADTLVRFEILNMAEMASAANIHTDADGEIHLSLGLGNVMLHAIDEKTGKFGEELALVKEAGQVFTVQIKKNKEKENVWKAFDFMAPLDAPINPGILTSEEKKIRHDRMEHGNVLRNARNASWYREEAAAPYSEAVKERLKIARGNFEELIMFLSRSSLGDKALREALLTTLTLKDMTDVKASVLEEHLVMSAEYSLDLPKEIYVPYVLNPRVFNEQLTEYRHFIEAYFDKDTKKLFRRRPKEILQWIDANLRVKPEQNYKDLFMTPRAALESGFIDEMSRKILFVAICRTLGIPARLNPVSKEAEYYARRQFVKAIRQKGPKKTELRLTAKDIKPWIDRQTFTVSRLENGFYHRLDLPQPVAEEAGGYYSVQVEPGRYRLTSVNRLPNGHMYAYHYNFTVGTKPVEIELKQREADLLETVSHNPIFPFELQTALGAYTSVENILTKPTNLICFLEEGKEPTEHILNEMLQQKEDFQNVDADIYFIVKEPDALKQVTLAKALETFPRVKVLYDDFTDNPSGLARRMYVDPDKLPLVILMHDGLTGIYASSGYNVGLGDILIRLIHALHPEA